MSLVRSNLGFLRTLTFLMMTFSRGKILEQSFVICLAMPSERLNDILIIKLPEREENEHGNLQILEEIFEG